MIREEVSKLYNDISEAILCSDWKYVSRCFRNGELEPKSEDWYFYALWAGCEEDIPEVLEAALGNLRQKDQDVLDMFLSRSVWSCSKETIKMLLDLGADPNAYDGLILACAAMIIPHDGKLLPMLFKAGGDPKGFHGHLLDIAMLSLDGNTKESGRNIKNLEKCGVPRNGYAGIDRLLDEKS